MASSRHARESGHPEEFAFPGFRVALAIASLPGMTIELCRELQGHHTSGQINLKSQYRNPKQMSSQVNPKTENKYKPPSLNARHLEFYVFVHLNLFRASSFGFGASSFLPGTRR